MSVLQTSVSNQTFSLNTHRHVVAVEWSRGHSDSWGASQWGGERGLSQQQQLQEINRCVFIFVGEQMVRRRAAAGSSYIVSARVHGTWQRCGDLCLLRFGWTLEREHQNIPLELAYLILRETYRHTHALHSFFPQSHRELQQRDKRATCGSGAMGCQLLVYTNVNWIG